MGVLLVFPALYAASVIALVWVVVKEIVMPERAERRRDREDASVAELDELWALPVFDPERS